MANLISPKLTLVEVNGSPSRQFVDSDLRQRTGVPVAACAALFCVAFAPFCALAQYRFDSWTTDNGLPQNSIHVIRQARDGYLWLATWPANWSLRLDSHGLGTVSS
jgi:hypothetical protein